MWTHRPEQSAISDTAFDEASYMFYLFGFFTMNGSPSISLLPEIYLSANTSDRWYLPSRSRLNTTSDDTSNTQSMAWDPRCCSSSDVCGPYYYCLLTALASEGAGLPRVTNYRRCIEKRFGQAPSQRDLSSWDCVIFLSSYDADISRHDDQFYPCGDARYDLNTQNWERFSVDANFQVALTGGVDTQGVYWAGPRDNEKMMQTLGRDFWNFRGAQCSLETPCQPNLDCNSIGSWTAIGLGNAGKPRRQPWVLLATSALKNINQQLANQYGELKDAIESLALDTFSIDSFYPIKGQNPGLRDSLTGLSSIFSVLGGFIPNSGPTISAAGTIVSAVSTFISNSISASDPLVVQKSFADDVLAFYRAVLEAMEKAVTTLFDGGSVRGDPNIKSNHFNITDMMKDGVWVDPNVLTKVTDLNSKIRIEVLSRSIDQLWKTWPKNKMWVLFVDLQNGSDSTKCHNDLSGPQDSKYCDDGVCTAFLSSELCRGGPSTPSLIHDTAGKLIDPRITGCLLHIQLRGN